MEMDRYIGRLLDNRYEILEVIGTGGMAVVYKARCHRLNRLVAVKILKDDFFRDEEFRRRFHAESQAVAMLSHPNIVSVYDVAASDDADYIVMELIDGITLKQYLEIRGVLNWKETLHFAIQIGKALDHAHSRGIIHRDIKPHNVMVLKNGSVKVTDFGIARVMSNNNSLTKEALGSVHYISPEQAKGGHVDNRSDLYSLGVVMYEMMTGRPPYDGESPVAVAIQHINGKAKAPSSLNPNVPGGLEQIIMRAMEQNPKKRYPSAAKMLYDMDEFRKDPTILFDYNNPNADIDAATKFQSKPVEKKEDVQPRVVADRPVSRVDRPVRQAPPKPANRRPREVIVEEETERSSKVATIAIVFCAVVAVIAIVVCIFAITNSAKNDMIAIPNLVGMTEEQANALTDIRITVQKQHSDKPAGEIIGQTPVANSRIAKGGKVTIIVSMGPEIQTFPMADLSGTKKEDAESFLKGQGLNLKLVLKYENHPTIVEGNVIRTDPGVNVPLSAGQTIYLFISTGPDVKVGVVPSTILGLNYEKAKSQLNSRGFYNIELQMVDSSAELDTVVDISVEEGASMDVNTQIILYLSNGKGTVEVPTEPTEPTVRDPDLISTVVTVNLPMGWPENYELSVYADGALVEVIAIPADTISRDVEVTGKGVMTFDFKIGELVIQSVTVDFELLREDPEIPDEPEVPDGPETPVEPENPEEPTDPTEPTEPIV